MEMFTREEYLLGKTFVDYVDMINNQEEDEKEKEEE